jgi:hypothetical protein
MKTKKSLGSALILTTILLFVILGMVVSLTYVTVMEQKMSGKTKSSVTSFYNAESGIEWVLNKIASNSGTNISSTFGTQWDSANSLVNCPDSFGDNECKIYLLDQDGNVIQNSTTALSEVKAVRSVGTQGQETQRAIEAAVAGSNLQVESAHNIQSPNGSSNCTGTYTGGYCSGVFFKDITFSKNFSSPPDVIVTPEIISTAGGDSGGASDNVHVEAINITATGFRMVCNGSPLGGAYDGYSIVGTCGWLAIGQ